ncbi:MAG: hypothetical protein FJ293_03465 [Planctomycetes bacterium]|nr:hypothetical protein [Planctomycetota bacterium]
MGVKIIGVALLLAGLPLLARQERGGADPAREGFARTAIDHSPGREIELRYRQLAWSEEAIARVRADPGLRQRWNQTIPIALQSELSTPVALMVGGRRLEPDRYRIGLWLDEGGAFDLSILLDQDHVRFPLELAETDQRFPYLTCSLLPAPEGGIALVIQWGSEYGRIVLDFAR